ncbi:carbohydrate-binding protein [Pseudobacteroides cellulosolvens]|uniref:Carbohydrate binding family 6 n=1 Tax=Pseudobacteroides cellulosolvens ATCC 35603 = DSM 2933 TaxID=398512 RepID=A0A0L6JI33_9FIRM|nr:carbohydrate-binding protein [Pseudobacteroides cellulosolvens]KNY25137.1 Carbohydrate binding family 6 [Pseudobacteroides cellulosolvens ATCC 35603 = DSM 2933]
MKSKKLVIFVLTIVYGVSLAFSYSHVNFSEKSFAESFTTIDVAVISAPTPTPTQSKLTAIDNSVPAYFSQKGEWSIENFGYGGSCISTTKIGSTAMWKFRVPVNGYYDITALIPDGIENALAKYTVFCDDQYIDSFYNVNSKGNFKLNKNYGKFMQFMKDSVIKVVIKSVSDGKCIADAMSFNRLEYAPTPLPTSPAGYSRPIMVEAENCSSTGTVIENGYISSCNDGDYIVMENVLLSGYSGYDSADIFSVNAAVAATEGKTGKLEIRMDGLDGTLIGTVQLKDTGDGLTKFSEQAYMLDRMNADFKAKDVYIIYKGDGTCNLDWVKFSRHSKPEPAQSEFLDLDPLGKKICGYIKAGFDSTNSLINAGFIVETLMGSYVLTDSKGYFELNSFNSSPVSLKVSKKGYLDRKIINIDITDTTIISTEDKPIEMWPGDIVKDNAINMVDVIDLAKAFNSKEGDELYNTACDINMDKVINIADIVIIAKYFGKTINDYK